MAANKQFPKCLVDKLNIRSTIFKYVIERRHAFILLFKKIWIFLGIYDFFLLERINIQKPFC